MLTAHDLANASFGLAVYNFGGVVDVLLWAVLVTILGSRGPMLSASHVAARVSWDGRLPGERRPDIRIRPGDTRVPDVCTGNGSGIRGDAGANWRIVKFTARRVHHSSRSRDLLVCAGDRDAVCIRRSRVGP